MYVKNSPMPLIYFSFFVFFGSTIAGFELGSYGNNSAPLDWLNNPENPDYTGDVAGPGDSSDPGNGNGDPTDPNDSGNDNPTNPGDGSGGDYVQVRTWFLGTVLAWISLSLVC
jgi:hypothetical protein